MEAAVTKVVTVEVHLEDGVISGLQLDQQNDGHQQLHKRNR